MSLRSCGLRRLRFDMDRAEIANDHWQVKIAIAVQVREGGSGVLQSPGDAVEGIVGAEVLEGIGGAAFAPRADVRADIGDICQGPQAEELNVSILRPLSGA